MVAASRTRPTCVDVCGTVSRSVCVQSVCVAQCRVHTVLCTVYSDRIVYNRCHPRVDSDVRRCVAISVTPRVRSSDKDTRTPHPH